jgi:hypothetical protein
VRTSGHHTMHRGCANPKGHLSSRSRWPALGNMQQCACTSSHPIPSNLFDCPTLSPPPSEHQPSQEGQPALIPALPDMHTQIPLDFAPAGPHGQGPWPFLLPSCPHRAGPKVEKGSPKGRVQSQKDCPPSSLAPSHLPRPSVTSSSAM